MQNSKERVRRIECLTHTQPERREASELAVKQWIRMRVFPYLRDLADLPQQMLLHDTLALITGFLDIPATHTMVSTVLFFVDTQDADMILSFDN